MNTKIIKFDLNKNLYDTLIAKQGDTKSRFLLFNLLDGSIPFSLENRSVRVYAIKPDRTEVFNDLIITDASKGYCILELTTQMLAVAGTVKLELMVMEGDKKLTSNIFYMDVKESINSEKAVVSTNEFGTLLTALASLNEYDNYKNEIKNARGGEANLNARLNNFNEQLDKCAKKTDLTNPFNFKGSCLSSELPTSANINDTYYCTDLNYRKTWNGESWFQSSLDEAQYTDDLANLKNDLSFIYSEENVIFEQVKDKVIKNNLSIADLSGFYTTNIIELNANQTIKFLGKGYKDNNVTIALSDSTGKILRNLVPCSSNDYIEYEYTATHDCYVRLCSLGIIDNVIKLNRNICEKQLKEDLSVISEINIINEECKIQGYILPSDGNINTTSTTYKRTDFIPIATLVNKTIESDKEIIVTVFDKDENFLGGYWINLTGNKSYYTISTGEYVVFSVKTTDIDSIYIGGLKLNEDFIKENFYKLRTLCIGDSLTFGGTSLTSSTDKNYPYYLEKYMDCITYNHGRSGETAQTWWNKWRSSVNYNIKYDIVLIMLGTNGGLTDTLSVDVEPYNDYNNYADTTTGCYCKIIEEVMKQTNNNAQIFLIIPPYHHYSDEKFQQLQSARNIIPKIAERYCLPIIDAYRDSGMNAFNGHIYRAIDDLHFNEEGHGYEKLATLFASQIKAKRSFRTTE